MVDLIRSVCVRVRAVVRQLIELNEYRLFQVEQDNNRVTNNDAYGEAPLLCEVYAVRKDMLLYVEVIQSSVV